MEDNRLWPATGGIQGMSLNPMDKARKRLYGKIVTNLDLAKEIKSMQDAGMTQKEIGVKLGYKDPKSIRAFLSLAATVGLEKKKKQTQTAAWKFYNSTDQFSQDPLIIKWVDNMQNRTRGGKPCLLYTSPSPRDS